MLNNIRKKVGNAILGNQEDSKAAGQGASDESKVADKVPDEEVGEAKEKTPEQLKKELRDTRRKFREEQKGKLESQVIHGRPFSTHSCHFSPRPHMVACLGSDRWKWTRRSPRS
jgi:hypothetical protein